MGRIKLSSPGIHNILNTLGAIGAAFELDVDFETVRKALEEFTGADRRFQIKGEINNIMIVDDYAHHPTEIRATLAAAKRGWNRKVIAVFQPHRYTRTQALFDEFSKAFYQADELIVTEIYSAGEAPIEGVKAKQIADGVQEHGHRNVRFISDFEEIVDHLQKNVRPGDTVLTLGAGNIYQVGEKLIEKLH
jgi:UDP-N-acetylmuramate--alanine ligase